MSSPDQAEILARSRRLQVPGRRVLAALLAVVVLVGAVAAVALSMGGGSPAHHAVAQGRLVAEAPDPLARDSFPDPTGARTHARASAPSVAAAGDHLGDLERHDVGGREGAVDGLDVAGAAAAVPERLLDLVELVELAQ